VSTTSKAEPGTRPSEWRHAFAGGSGDPQAAVAAIVATTAATTAMTLTVKVSASGDGCSSLDK